LFRASATGPFSLNTQLRMSGHGTEEWEEEKQLKKKKEEEKEK
jgi:hypothetical protein